MEILLEVVDGQGEARDGALVRDAIGLHQTMGLRIDSTASVRVAGVSVVSGR
jgi:hypothetical protein